jgi:hypothetical protein
MISPMNARFFEPMLCSATVNLPNGPEWQYQLTRLQKVGDISVAL